VAFSSHESQQARKVRRNQNGGGMSLCQFTTEFSTDFLSIQEVISQWVLSRWLLLVAWIPKKVLTRSEIWSNIIQGLGSWGTVQDYSNSSFKDWERFSGILWQWHAQRMIKNPAFSQILGTHSVDSFWHSYRLKTQSWKQDNKDMSLWLFSMGLLKDRNCSRVWSRQRPSLLSKQMISSDTIWSKKH
jgi:hypothetical protein